MRSPKRGTEGTGARTSTNEGGSTRMSTTDDWNFGEGEWTGEKGWKHL